MWNNVEIGFEGEETTNFGPRNESGTALYQVETVATISPQDEVFSNPRLLSCSSRSGLCVVAGQDLSLFDENGHRFKFTISFDSEVDVVAWSEDSQFLVVAESGGTVHIVSVLSEQILFSQELVQFSDTDTTSEDDSLDSTKTFNNITMEAYNGRYNLIISSNHHGCFVFSNILLEQLCEALQNGDAACALQVKKSIQMECIDTNCIHTERTYYSMTFERDDMMSLLTVGSGDSSITIWHDIDNKIQPLMSADHFLPDCSIVKCRISHDWKTLYALDEMKSLSVWDLKSLTMFTYWSNIKVKDFILSAADVSVKADHVGFKSELKLIVLTDPDPQCYLKVYSIPAMRQIYSLQVGAHSALVDSPLSQDGIYLVEGVQEDGEEFVSALHLRYLMEALPETRFHKLLHKRRFEDAIQFAKQFDLDVEDVYIVKSGSIIDEVSPWSNHLNLDIPKLFESLMDCLEHITDIEKVVDICMVATFPCYENTCQLLSYVRTRVSKCLGSKINHSGSQSKALTERLTNLYKVQRRLDTFVMAYGTKEFSASRWDKFHLGDLLPECIDLLRQGSICKAATLWKRHQDEFEEKFTKETLSEVLLAVPESVKSIDMIPWLRDDLIPFVKGSQPNAQNLHVLALWIEKRVRNLEFLEKDNWPMNGLELAEIYFKSNQKYNGHSRQYSVTPVASFNGQECKIQGVKLLKELTQQLKELISLQSNYSYIFTLVEFMQETRSSVTFRMLDRVAAPELIPQCIDKVVRPYMKQHKLPAEELLFKYIEDLIERSGDVSSYYYEASWEGRAVAVIQCIKDLDYFCQALLSLMSKAALPWNDIVENVVEQGLALDHPRVSQLKQQYDVVNLRKMLLKYDIHNYNTSDESQAANLWKFVLSVDSPTSMTDALQVTKAYSREKTEDVYMFRLRFLVHHGRVADCIDLLKSLSSDESLRCARRLLTWTHVILQNELDDDADEEFIEDENREKITVTKAAVSVARFLLDKEVLEPAEIEELQATLHDTKCISNLQVEFNKFLSLEDYRDESMRVLHLRDYALLVFSEKNQQCTDKASLEDIERKTGAQNSFTSQKLYRLAELLGVSADELKGQLAIQAAKSGEVETVIKMCKELHESIADEKTGEILYTVAHTLCKVQSEKGIHNQWCTQEIYHLASQAVIVCAPDLLHDCLELCKCSRLADQVYQQCETEEYGTMFQSAVTDSHSSLDKNLFNELTFHSFYEEEKLVLDSSVAMPLANQFTLCCFPRIHSVDERQPLQQDSIVGLPEYQIGEDEDTDQHVHLLTSLGQNTTDLAILLQGSDSLTLSYILHTLSICVLFSASRYTGQQTDKNTEELNSAVKQIITYGNDIIQQYSLKLLYKILGSKVFDVELALACAQILPYETAVEKLQHIVTSSGPTCGKVIGISKVGKALASCYQDKKVFSDFEQLCTKAEWGQKLNQISFKDAFNSQQVANYQNVLTKMIEHHTTEVQLFKDYCRDFQLTVEDGLLLYLEMLLSPPEDQMQNSSGTSESLPIDMLAVNCVLEEIKNKDAVKVQLYRILDKINFYDYKRIEFVLCQIKSYCNLQEEENQTLQMGQKLLSYLSMYTRRNKPSQYEFLFRYKTEDEQLLNDTEPLPEMSNTRLPFHPLIYGYPWKILTQEVTADTVSKLLPIAEVLKLSHDELYALAVDNEITKVLKQWEQQELTNGESSIETGWNSSQCIDLKTLETFKSLFLNIKNCKMSVAAARYVAQKLPKGPYQVLILKLCTMLALRWKDTTQSDPKTHETATHAHNKLTEKYKRVATEQVLHKYNLAEPANLMLVNNPARLIFTLYEHKSIEERESNCAVEFPDIHTAADKIAAVAECNVQKIRHTLFDKWLHSQIDNTDDLESGEMTGEELCLRRLVYLLQHGEVKQNAEFLLKSISESSGATLTSRIRAIRCLFALMNEEEIEQMTSQPVSAIRDCMKTYIYLAKLEPLNITMSIKEFTDCNKFELIRRLWRNHSHEPKALSLMSDLCQQYEINDTQLWNGILQQFMILNMMPDLQYVIVEVSTIQDLWQIPCLVQAWKTVLLNSLTSVTAPLSDKQLKMCHELFLLLLRCPVIFNMDMIGFSKQFQQLQMTCHAFACLLLVSNADKKTQQTKALLSSGCHAVILDEIEKLSTMRLSLPQMDQIVDAVFDNIVSTEKYTLLMSTSHCEKLYHYLAKTKNIDCLLLRLLEDNRIEDCVKFVDLYCEYNAETLPANQTVKDFKKGEARLKMYLETHHLLDQVTTDIMTDLESST